MNLDLPRIKNLSKKLESSDDYVIFRFEDKCIYCHLKNDNSLSMLPIILSEHDELYEFIVQTVNEIKKEKNENH